ncbi:MAG: hypothetical protein ACRD8Z_09000 [Nitrososphaeraceae archaeon]
MDYLSFYASPAASLTSAPETYSDASESLLSSLAGPCKPFANTAFIISLDLVIQ